MHLQTRKKKGDDASLLAPDNWSGISRQDKIAAEQSGFFISQEKKEFYCRHKKHKFLIISENHYFITGVESLFGDVSNISLHASRNICQYGNDKFDIDAVIYHASDMDDIQIIFRTALSLNVETCIVHIIAIADEDIRYKLLDIAEKHGNISIVSSSVSISKMKHMLMKHVARTNQSNKGKKYFPSTLTPYQADILSMTAMGLTTSAIASLKRCSISTVYTTRARALNKAGASCKALEAILYAHFNISQSKEIYQQ